jgi:hypothetical protein
MIARAARRRGITRPAAPNRSRGKETLRMLMQSQLNDVVAQHQGKARIVWIAVPEMFGCEVELFNGICELRKHVSGIRCATLWRQKNSIGRG